MSDRGEHFEHRADIGVRGIAATLAGAFEQAALALTAVVCDPATVVPREAVPIACDAADDEGEPIDATRHHPAVEVKGATYTALRVACGDDGMWTAQTVVDV